MFEQSDEEELVMLEQSDEPPVLNDDAEYDYDPHVEGDYGSYGDEDCGDQYGAFGDEDPDHQDGSGEDPGRETVRVRSREDEKVPWSRKAARLAGTIRNMMDAATTQDGVYPAQVVPAESLRKLGTVLDNEHAAPAALSNMGMDALWSFLQDVKYLDAPLALEKAQEEIVRRVYGKTAEELQELLYAENEMFPFRSDDERVAALAEPAFLPCGYGIEIMEDDVRIMALAKVAARTLIEIKGVSRTWAVIAQRALCRRVCCHNMEQPVPTEHTHVTDLNIYVLIDAGRGHDAVRAGHELPNLARLHGEDRWDGQFTVDVSALRAAVLPTRAPKVQDEEDFQQDPFGGKVLRRCITGGGEPTLELLLTAVACAASGTVHGVPVQQLREDDAIDELNLDKRDLGPAEGRLLANLLAGSTSLLTLKLNCNRMGPKGAEHLGEALNYNTILQTLSLGLNGLGDAGAQHLAKGLAQNKSLTSLDLGSNSLYQKGTFHVAVMLAVNKSITSIDLWSNGIGATGASALGKALKTNSTLKELILTANRLGSDGIEVLMGTEKHLGVICDKSGMNPIVGPCFNLKGQDYDLCMDEFTRLNPQQAQYVRVEPPDLHGLNTNVTLTSLNVAGNKIGKEGAAALGKLLENNSTLKSLNLEHNDIMDEGAQALSKALEINDTLQTLAVQGNNVNGAAKAELLKVAVGRIKL